MRIQHNIMAMNAYRNYNTNTSALAKNLEKLSSGYKINRAGDDAAGLAISEKMRAQISGLNAAQKNVKDGISLVKTAEGAMQEIQDMLNRMDYLATQSANGTYDDPVDRLNLQKEVDALKDEINRIADSANFNGINLLDGSMSTDGGVTSINNFSTSLATSETAAVAGKYTLTATSMTSCTSSTTLRFNVGVDGGSGKGVSVEITFNTGATKAIFNGKEYQLSTTGTVGKSELAAILADSMRDTLSNDFTISVNASAITLENKVAGTSSPKIGSTVMYKLTSGAAVATVASAVKFSMATSAADASLKFNKSQIKVCTDATKISDSIFTINGKRVAVVKDSATVNKVKDKNLYCIVAATNSTDPIQQELSQLTGLTIKLNGNDYEVSNGNATTGSGLRLQIGDTADSFNQMKVSIGDMHTTAMGIKNIDISTQDGAGAAIKVIKNAINYVSGVRGDLGAVQNRLEHTQKNLSVMAENIQDAESTIRDTDVADEMMAYTKNNILIQSAQAMLAQANAVPQGVLQLLG